MAENGSGGEHSKSKKNGNNFTVRLDEIIESSSIGLGLTIGYRVGLIKTLCDLNEPKTSPQIAEIAGLNERYVREWLALMAVSKVINIDKATDTYFLPRDRVSQLQHAIKRILLEEMFVMFPAILGELDACFKNGGGIPYSSYEGFHKVMDAMSVFGHKENLLQNHIPSIEGLHERLESGIKCLDVGCGSGSPGLLMGRRYPNSQFYGFDFSEQAIETAQKEAEAMGLKNTNFIVMDCAVYDEKYAEMFEFISAHDAIHDQAKPADVLSGIFKMLKKGGIFSMVDVDAHSHPADNMNMPKAPLKYTISLLHCMPVSLFFEGGAGLGTCWGQELALKMLKDAGFSQVEIKHYHGDSFNIHYVARK